MPSSAVAPAPVITGAGAPGTQVLTANDEGFVYVETKSKLLRCRLDTESVGCDSQFDNSPMIDGQPATFVSVSSAGTLRWIAGNLDNDPSITLDYGHYAAVGWTIIASPGGIRFTNDATAHGMYVGVEGVQYF